MPENIVNSFIKKTGKSKKEIENVIEKAKKEAKKMGMEDNLAYITAISKTMLGIKESNEKILELIKEYMKSNKSFKEFYEMLTAGSIEQGDIPDTLKYAERPQEDDQEEDEEGKKYKIVKVSPEAKKNLEVPKNYKL